MDVNKPVTIRIDGRKFDNNSQADTVQTIKKRIYQMKNYQSDHMNNGLELSRDEQAERVNLLLLGLASLILMNAMAVLIISFVKLSKYEDQLVMNSNIIKRQTRGFPQLQVAMISDMGYIIAFSIDGPVYETFPKLQYKKFDDGCGFSGYLCPILEHFGVYYDDVMYYLSTNPDTNVVKHILDEGYKFRLIEQSRIPNHHLKSIKETQHLQEMWLEGPDLPERVIDSIREGGPSSVCATALNRTSVFFIGIGESTQEMLVYDFAKDSWIELESSPKPKIKWCTSSSAHDKNYNQKVYVLAAGNHWQSYWMIFDVATQFWTFSPNNLEGLEINCCPGRILTIRNIHYYFHNEPDGASGLSPYYRILDNGTSIDLKISDVPFSKELKAAHEKSQANPNGEGYGFISIELAPFYQRFYEDVPK